ncbi:MAG: hypothetical protein ABI635_10130 [Actinomycetota bacterium]
MQIAIEVPQMRRSEGGGARLVSLVTAIALLLLAGGTARAIAGAAPSPGFQSTASGLDQMGSSMPLTIPVGAPGDTAVSTTTIVLRGSAPASVRLSSEVNGGLAPYLHVTILRGDGEGAAWVADPGAPVFDGTLASLPTGWASAVPDGTWQTGEHHTYRIQVTLMDDQRAQGQVADATFRWESRSAA